MAARGSFDTASLDWASRQVTGAASNLDDLTSTLASIPSSSLPNSVIDALGHLKSHGHDMISDIHAETAKLATDLYKVSQCYVDLENSIMTAFGGAL